MIKDDKYFEEKINKMLEGTEYRAVLFSVRLTKRQILGRVRKKIDS